MFNLLDSGVVHRIRSYKLVVQHKAHVENPLETTTQSVSTTPNSRVVDSRLHQMGGGDFFIL